MIFLEYGLGGLIGGWSSQLVFNEPIHALDSFDSVDSSFLDTYTAN
jgi:hypothetical protein